MNNTSNKVQAQQPQLPEGISSEFYKTIGVIAVLVLAFMNFDVVIRFMMNIMILIYRFVGHDFGIAIIVFTVLIRVLSWPLNAQQMKGTKAMQEFQNDKEWIAAQKKYAKDKEKLNMEMMRLQRERGINMFGSCLPMLIQFPILFTLIPSITYAIGSSPISVLNLSRKLYAWQSVAALVPLNSKFLGFMDLGLPQRTELFGLSIPLIALIVGITTYIQTKLTTPPTASANPNDQAAQTNKMMGIYMPVMFYFICVNYPTGLSVYFLVGNILGIIQYALMGNVNWRNLLPGGQSQVQKQKK